MDENSKRVWDAILPFECDDLIRIGSRFDGGYVHSFATVKNSRALLSFGIDQNWDFEKDFQLTSKCREVHAYDNSINRRTFLQPVYRECLKKIKQIRKFKSSKQRIVARPLSRLLDFCATFSGDNMFMQRTISSDTGPGQSTLTECLSRLKCTENIFLKCDIEGGEYEIIDDLVLHADRLSGLIIEFHNIAEKPDTFLGAVYKISKRFRCIHSHINNHERINQLNCMPVVVEMSFSNQNEFKNSPHKSRANYPIVGLDFPNNPAVGEIPITFHVTKNVEGVYAWKT
jgi:hypothetical protein